LLFKVKFNPSLFMKLKQVLGIDVGGSGIKGAIINTKTGELITERYRIPTPPPARPDQVVDVIGQIVKRFEWNGAIGVGFPAVVQQGIAKTAANVDKSFIGTNIESAIMKLVNCPVRVVNDADAAGIAEMKFGAGKDNKGLVLLITVGTGLGTVLFSQGKLVPNTELGHIFMPNGKEAEFYSSDAARQREKLSWKEWALRFDEYLNYMESLFWPDLIIIGGGVSKNEEKYAQYLTVKASVVAAQLQNHAGVIGAAVAAKKMIESSLEYNS
jgi:polyphosphate glucokinase